MHVITAAIGLLQHLFAGEVGEDAQLDLGVVSTEQRPAVLGKKGLADAAAVFGANRDVLQVRVAAAQSPGGGDGLVEVGVHTPCFRFHQLR